MDKDFEAEFSKLMEQAIPRAVREGFARSGMMLLHDAIVDVPKVPIEEGTLRGSGSVHVDGKPTSTSAGLTDGEGGTPNTDPIAPGPSSEITTVVGFNTPYAARLHEHPEYNFKQAGTGGKYLESKLAANKEIYFGEVADAVKDAIAKAQGLSA